MRYAKAQNQFHPTLAHWGTFTRYLEIADDGYAHRQVDAFLNGICLRYDRKTWVDEHGMLAEANLDHMDLRKAHKQSSFHAQVISPEEFETGWARAATAPNQPQSYDSSEFGLVPNHLEMTPEQINRLPPWLAEFFSRRSE